jgi:hypothetical protein
VAEYERTLIAERMRRTHAPNACAAGGCTNCRRACSCPGRARPTAIA